jgi:hypothetical protein
MTVLRIALAALAAAAITAHAQPGKGNSRGQQQQQQQSDTNVSVNIVFGDRDRAIISDYYRAAPGGGPKSMPPGHAKQLARNGTLPPGIAKKQLPGDLIGRLPPVPRGYDRVIIGSDVVLVQLSTNTIMDVIQGIVR